MSDLMNPLFTQFNRCITSQMIKWFSNFREFYYIQMEKYARQALSDGVTNAQALAVLRDSELFRVLNTHYNKGNDFEVRHALGPTDLRCVFSEWLADGRHKLEDSLSYDRAKEDKVQISHFPVIKTYPAGATGKSSKTLIPAPKTVSLDDHLRPVFH